MAACLLGVSFISSANRQTQLALDIDVANRGPEIGNLHYGIFFEEINHAGDGGLYAELIRNRSFEDNESSPEAWSKIGNPEWKIISDGLINDI